MSRALEEISNSWRKELGFLNFDNTDINTCYSEKPFTLVHRTFTNALMGGLVRGCPYITSAAITRQGHSECLRNAYLRVEGFIQKLMSYENPN